MPSPDQALPFHCATKLELLPPAVLKNDAPQGNWIRVSLAGTRSNRSAIGARVTVEVDGKRQMQEVASGSSYYSQNELALYFGLGSAERADVRVRWPNGGNEVFRGLAVNRTHIFRESGQTP